MKRTTALLAVALLATLSPGCGKPQQNSLDDLALSGWVGEHVQVQFRRDALGAAAALPVSPTTGSINGAETSIYGKLIKIAPDAVLLESADRVRWIPREVILLIDADKSVTQKQL